MILACSHNPTAFKRGRTSLYLLLLLDEYRTMCLQNVAESGNAAACSGVIVRLFESRRLVALPAK